MNKLCVSIALAVAGFGVSAALPASAATIIASGTGLAAPVTTITFSEFGVSSGAVVTNQYESLGATFGSLTATEGLYQTTSGSPGNGLQNYFPDTYNPFSIKFTGTVTEAAFEMITNGYTDKFTAKLNGVEVESFTHTTGNWAYYGFTGITFDEIVVNVGYSSTATNKHMRLDNVQIGAITPVPVSATVPLLLSALGGLCLIGRRRKAA